MSFWKNLKEKIFKKKSLKTVNAFSSGLTKSNQSFKDLIDQLRTRHIEIDEKYFNDLEELLIQADISYHYVEIILDLIKAEVKKNNFINHSIIEEIIVSKIFEVYAQNQIVDVSLNINPNQKNIILITGVNGSGKTTTIAKLAFLLKTEYKILLVAGDTFRAGANEQLEFWAKKVGVDLIKSELNQDSSSVVYKALEKLKNQEYNLLIIDTAGRLQNKVNLMNELKKINSTIQRFYVNGPQESLLVIDGTTGQNGLNQAIVFKEAIPLSGIILTKMDGTSKGGIILSIKELINLPVKYISFGEKLEDLQEFDLDNFIYGLIKNITIFTDESINSQTN
ncbi:MAG: signal recognition particle-docking protein FtsY [Mycoplasma sp.]|nr:signal recognition particle-docking protein FtsY [Mycoplasma sp.]